jgi:acyl-coenzyme A synthetase/AMP-(fatty) acid ligase
VTAYVVPAQAAPDAEQILAWTRQRLAAYKCPKLIRFLPDLPRTANGKVVRLALERAWRDHT